MVCSSRTEEMTLWPPNEVLKSPSCLRQIMFRVHSQWTPCHLFHFVVIGGLGLQHTLGVRSPWVYQLEK